MSHDRIKRILDGVIFDFEAGSPADKKFHIVYAGIDDGHNETDPYVRLSCLPVETNDETLDGDITLFHGIYNVDIFSPWGLGHDTSLNAELADRFFKLLRVNKMFHEYDDIGNIVFSTQVTKPLHTKPSRRAVDATAWWVTPCSIEYKSYVSTPPPKED